ncbi:MAG: TlpA family protein disulfide reductase [Chitinophagaceae bacterium]
MKRKILILIAFLFSLPVFGQELKMIKITGLEKIIAESKTPLIINFWATFCKPCMEEIPYFQKLNADYKKDGLQILFVSLDMQNDFPDKVNSFIQKRKISTYWLDETNADYFCPIVDPSWSGAIPASLFIFNKNEYRKFIEEPLSEKELNKEVRILLGKSK